MSSLVRDRADRYVWNPMSRMSEVVGRQRVWVRGEGSRLYDADGRVFVDGCASLWYVNAGYGRTEIIEAVNEQMSALPAWMLFGPNVTPAAVELAELLSSLTPGDLNRSYFTCGGSESNEIAFKIARQYFRLQGQPGRYKILARRGSYHGSTFGALSATGTPHNRSMFEPLVPGFRHVPPDSLDAMRETILFEGPDTVAALLVDPSAAASGIRFPPDDYMVGLRALCDEYGILLISDEVICGFGRTGTWFGVDHWGVVPDLMTLAKGMSSGYLPIGAVAVSDQVFELFASEDAGAGFMSGNTYAGHAACCAAAIANIRIIDREDLLSAAVARGEQLFDGCSKLSSPIVESVTGGRGLAVGVHLSAEFGPDPAARVAAGAYERGVLVRALTPTIVTISPPLVITAEEVSAIVEAVTVSIGELRANPQPVEIS